MAAGVLNGRRANDPVEGGLGGAVAVPASGAIVGDVSHPRREG